MTEDDMATLTPTPSLKGRNFLKELDYTPEEIG